MALLTWDEKYSVCVKTFDEQHQQLFGCLNELHEAMRKGMANSAIQGILIKLLRYTKQHFAEEEAMMARLSYPGYAKQCTAHRLLTTKVDEFVERHRKGELALSVSLMQFLKEWLERHIVGMDQEYSAFMGEHGIH